MSSDTDVIVPQSAPQAVEGRQTGSSIVRNGLVANGATLAGVLTGFFLTPILIHHVGTENFGLWSLLTSIVGQIAIVQCGLSTAIPRKVAASLAVGDKDELRRVHSTSFAAYTACAAFTIAVTALLCWKPWLVMKVDPKQLSVIRPTLAIIGVATAVSYFIALRDALVFGSGRMFVISSINTVINLLTTLGFIGAAFMGWGTPGLACVYLGVLLLNLAVYRVLLKDPFARMRPSIEGVSRETLRDLLRVGRHPFLISLSGAMGSGANSMIIGALLSPQHVAFYAIANKLVSFVNDLSSKFSAVSLPVYAQAFAVSDFSQIRRVFTESVTMSLATIVPFLFVAYALGDRIILAWVGPGHQEAALLWTLGLAAFLCRVPGNVAFNFFNGTQPEGRITSVVLASGAVNAITSYGLTRLMGAPGVMWGTIIVAGLVDFLYLPAAACNRMQYSFAEYWRDTFGPLLPPIFVSGIMAWYIRNHGLPTGTLWTALAAFGMLFFAWSSWFFLGLPLERRQRFSGALRRAFRRGG